MLVSAISVNRNCVYNLSNNLPFYNNKNKDTVDETVFSSLSPSCRKAVSDDEATNIFENINSWQNFCHSQIVGEKLNTVV